MPAHLKENDQTLWSKFLDGNEQVLSIIYLRHANLLFDYGCKMTTDRDLVKDCIQDIFCTLIKNRENLSETDNIRLYLFKALKRKLVREIQKSYRTQNLEGLPEIGFDLAFLHRPDHTELELTDRQKQELTEAINSLTERQKEAIYLRFTRGLDYKEISAVLNLNYQSSRALIHRAIAKLRNILSGKISTFQQTLLLLFQQNGKDVV
ncbi:RNA polymerase sigma factor [Sunxiuqinia sp. sy24]|uniref:RNA polymerase sigma factor n=1 Tax=Sunxiuqinia sp. sy24 TaxID=3461495 RepID=UPI004045CFBE